MDVKGDVLEHFMHRAKMSSEDIQFILLAAFSSSKKNKLSR